MTFADLFCGIGGFRLGLERAGLTCKWACEIDDFCRKVYLKHWPETEPFYDDIRTIADPPGVDLVCGGFPCQPFSVAGKRQGEADTRNLWPEMLRVIELVRPSWVLGENVPGLGDYLDTVVSDLESRGFEVVPLEIEAAAVGANHRRARVWIVAHAAGIRRNRHSAITGSPTTSEAIRGMCQLERSGSYVPDATGERSREPGQSQHAVHPTTNREGQTGEPHYGSWWQSEPDVGRVAHGVSQRVDRLKALGNAVVPQVVEWIGRRIMESDALTRRMAKEEGK